MKNILATTALALMISTPLSTAAFAQMKPLNTYKQSQPTDIKASNFIGMRVYATESADYDSWTTNTRMDPGAEKEWDDIGEVNDVILSRDGEVKAVVLGVGGFIGIGEKDVAVQMSDIKMVSDGEEADEFFLVVKTNKEMLEQSEAYERTAAAATDVDMKTEETAEASTSSEEMKPQENADASEEVKPEQSAANTQMESQDTTAAAKLDEEELANTDGANSLGKPVVQESSAAMVQEDVRMERGTMPSENENMAALVEKEEDKRENEVDTTTTGSIEKSDANLDGAGREMLMRPNMQREGYSDAKPEELTAEMLTGARVYGTKDEDIGEVGELLLNGENQIDRLVLDIGGFLGLGEHNVAVTMDEVQIIRGEDGSDVRVYVNATQEQLERQPEYEG